MKIAEKKPCKVEFIQYTRNWKEIEEFLGDCYVGGQTERRVNGVSWVEIKTLDSIAKAFDGDYIIKGTQGEFYPCDKKIFEEIYTVLDDNKSGFTRDDLVNDYESTLYSSKYKIGQKVKVEFEELNMTTDEAYIRYITFTNSKVRYGIFLDKSETTIHNVDSYWVKEGYDEFVDFDDDNLS